MPDYSHVGEIPSSAYTAGSGENSVKALSSMTEQDAKARMRLAPDMAFQNAQGSLVTNILGGIANAIQQGLAGINLSGWFSSINDIGLSIQDGQNALATRLDLIPLGYCAAYMTQNINLAWGTDNLRRAPFKGKIGPSHGAHVDTANGGIIFDLPGTWTISALMNARDTGYTGSDIITMYVSVRRPDDSIYSEKVITSDPGVNSSGLSLTQPVVIPEAGYYVAVWVWSGRWRWWDGGTNKSGLTVLRSALETDNPGTTTVSDETQPA